MLRCQTRLHYRSVKALSPRVSRPAPGATADGASQPADPSVGRVSRQGRHLGQAPHDRRDRRRSRRRDVQQRQRDQDSRCWCSRSRWRTRARINLDERITIRKEDIRGGSGIFRYHDAGLQPTFRDVLLQMVITSDNTATDLAIAKVGGVGARQRVAEGIRLRGRPARSIADHRRLFAKYNALGPADDRNAKTNADRCVLARRDHAAQRRA